MSEDRRARDVYSVREILRLRIRKAHKAALFLPHTTNRPHCQKHNKAPKIDQIKLRGMFFKNTRQTLEDLATVR